MDTPIPLDSALLREVMTSVLLIAFVAVAAWAYSASRRAAFDELARVPLEDEPDGDDAP